MVTHILSIILPDDRSTSDWHVHDKDIPSPPNLSQSMFRKIKTNYCAKWIIITYLITTNETIN